MRTFFPFLARKHLLGTEDCSVNAMAGHFRMSRPAVSQHLRIPPDAGLVSEQRRGRERRHHLHAERLTPVRDWLAQYERLLSGLWMWQGPAVKRLISRRAA